MKLLDVFLILTCIIAVVYLFGRQVCEKFQRMNYIQMHNYLDSLYSNIIPSRYNYSPYRNTIPASPEIPSVGLTGRMGYIQSPVITSSGGGYHSNPDRVVGYLYSQDTNDNDIYELYEVYDHRRGRPGYAYKTSKEPYNRDALLVNIDHKSYSGDYLYDGDVVNITYENKPYVVKLYTIKSTALGTRYQNMDYQSGMREYALLEPVNPMAVVDDADKFYILYEQELDPSRQLNNYYIKDKRGIIVEIDTKQNKLYDGDTILIPGKERYGEYSLKELDRY